MSDFPNGETTGDNPEQAIGAELVQQLGSNLVSLHSRLTEAAGGLEHALTNTSAGEALSAVLIQQGIDVERRISHRAGTEDGQDSIIVETVTAVLQRDMPQEGSGYGVDIKLVAEAEHVPDLYINITGPTAEAPDLSMAITEFGLSFFDPATHRYVLIKSADTNALAFPDYARLAGNAIVALDESGLRNRLLATGPPKSYTADRLFAPQEHNTVSGSTESERQARTAEAKMHMRDGLGSTFKAFLRTTGGELPILPRDRFPDETTFTSNFRSAYIPNKLPEHNAEYAFTTGHRDFKVEVDHVLESVEVDDENNWERPFEPGVYRNRIVISVIVGKDENSLLGVTYVHLEGSSKGSVELDFSRYGGNINTFDVMRQVEEATRAIKSIFDDSETSEEQTSEINTT